MVATSSPPTHDRDPDVSQLATAARDGNRFAFQQLVTMLEPRIFRMIFYRTRSREDAEDICQDVFLKAFRSLKKLQQPERFESWLFRIAVNRVKDYHRRQKFRSLFSLLQDNDSEDGAQAEPTTERRTDTMDAIVRKEFWQKVQTMLGVKRLLIDHGVKEIAEVLDKSESTIKTHLYRSLGKFKKDAAFRAFIKEAQP